MAQVSVRTLRYYDEIGLLEPVWADPESGYRWYSPQQLHRLHRILALRDLGVPLAEIARLLDENLTTEAVRGILLLRRAEAHDRLAIEMERLVRVEARLKQLEEELMVDYDVVVKGVEGMWVLAVTEELASVDDIGPAHARLWPRVERRLSQLGVSRTAPSIAREVGDGPIQFTAALPVPNDTKYESDDLKTIELPALPRVAATVIQGDPDFHAANAALQAWIEEAGETAAGEYREVYLDCDGPRDTWVVEVQQALTPCP